MYIDITNIFNNLLTFFLVCSLIYIIGFVIYSGYNGVKKAIVDLGLTQKKTYSKIWRNLKENPCKNALLLVFACIITFLILYYVYTSDSNLFERISYPFLTVVFWTEFVIKKLIR